MPKELTDEQIFKILEKLPGDLKEALFSVETAEKIGEVCEKYEIPGEKVSLVANCVGQVLLGILSPEELEGALEKEVGLKKDVARGAGQQIYRYIFFPVKESLAALSGTIQMPPSGATKPKEEREEKPAPPSPAKPDVYRETVE